MNTAVVYSSRTGNTKKVAEAIHTALPGSKLFPVDEAPDPSVFDRIAMGFWIDKGDADAKALAYMKRIERRPVFTFFTLGASPVSHHASDCLKRAETHYGEGCVRLGSFCCQGAIDPKLIEWMKTLPPDHPHAPDDARRARWLEAEAHPDAGDLQAAVAAAWSVLK